MDTDDLSNESYTGILIEAEKFHHDLTLQFGVMASSCKNEKEYLQAAKELINEIKNLDETDFSDIFFDRIPAKDALNKCLQKILSNIAEVENIPESIRHYEF